VDDESEEEAANSGHTMLATDSSLTKHQGEVASVALEGTRRRLLGGMVIASKEEDARRREMAIAAAEEALEDLEVPGIFWEQQQRIEETEFAVLSLCARDRDGENKTGADEQNRKIFDAFEGIEGVKDLLQSLAKAREMSIRKFSDSTKRDSFAQHLRKAISTDYLLDLQSTLASAKALYTPLETFKGLAEEKSVEAAIRDAIVSEMQVYPSIVGSHKANAPSSADIKPSSALLSAPHTVRGIPIGHGSAIYNKLVVRTKEAGKEGLSLITAANLVIEEGLVPSKDLTWSLLTVMLRRVFVDTRALSPEAPVLLRTYSGEVLVSPSFLEIYTLSMDRTVWDKAMQAKSAQSFSPGSRIPLRPWKPVEVHFWTSVVEKEPSRWIVRAAARRVLHAVNEAGVIAESVLLNFMQPLPPADVRMLLRWLVHKELLHRAFEMEKTPDAVCSAVSSFGDDHHAGFWGAEPKPQFVRVCPEAFEIMPGLSLSCFVELWEGYPHTATVTDVPRPMQIRLEHLPQEAAGPLPLEGLITRYSLVVDAHRKLAIDSDLFIVH
jgi:hypothetical protein